jgi:hypothetical protein
MGSGFCFVGGCGIGMTISTFPEQPKEKTELEKGLTLQEQLLKIKEEENQLEKYKEIRNNTLLLPLKGLGVLVFMWGLLYTGFWISSGFSSDKKKDETNE